MGIRFRKSKKILPGVRLNLSAKSASVSVGPKGFKHTISTTGRKTTTVSVPGTGLSYSSRSGSSGSSSASGATGEGGTSYFAATKDRPTSPKSRSVALLLCLFLGFFGVHRFYVGKKITGVVWLLSVGVAGIGWIVDLVTIAIGSFYDVNGYVLRAWGGSEPELSQSVEYSEQAAHGDDPTVL